MPSDSCKNLLLPITHEIYPSMIDVKSEVSSLIYQKHFIKLINKLNQNGVTGNLLNTIFNFLDARKQRVVFNGQYSPWVDGKAGERQELILSPLFFLKFINDLSNNLV